MWSSFIYKKVEGGQEEKQTLWMETFPIIMTDETSPSSSLDGFQRLVFGRRESPRQQVAL